MSPQFIQMAGDSQFLFIKRLDATLKTTAGVSKDGVLGVSQYDTFMTGKTAKVYLKGLEEPLEGVKITKPTKEIITKSKYGILTKPNTIANTITPYIIYSKCFLLLTFNIFVTPKEI